MFSEFIEHWDASQKSYLCYLFLEINLAKEKKKKRENV